MYYLYVYEGADIPPGAPFPHLQDDSSQGESGDSAQQLQVKETKCLEIQVLG